MKTSAIQGVNNDKYNVIKYNEVKEKKSAAVQTKEEDTSKEQQKSSLKENKDGCQKDDYQKQLKEMNDQLDEMKRKNLEDSMKYMNQYKDTEEYTIGGPVSAGMYNLVSADNKMGLFRALRSGQRLSGGNDKDSQKRIEKIELDLLQDVNNEVRKSIQIGIKEAEAARINKHKDAKHKIKKIRIYIDPEEENKFDKSLNRYSDKKSDVTDDNSVDKASDEEVKHVDTKA